jgi:hypothetical protein
MQTEQETESAANRKGWRKAMIAGVKRCIERQKSGKCTCLAKIMSPVDLGSMRACVVLNS